jgi:serine/threonine protein kinase/Tol biopolymer transport system component
MSQGQTGAAFIGRELGHYRITKLLGRGGMGDVYLAEDTRLNRKVALKCLSASASDDGSRVRRFEQEALAASALNHPNILTVYEFVADQGQQFLVTEFVDGKTLREVLHHPTFALEDVLRIAEQTALALSAAHKAGIVHRDIKPENIMLREDGIVKVLDFGLAKLRRPDPRRDEAVRLSTADAELETSPLVTMPGNVMGTTVYMSPEQARGKEVDERTDVWSLGVVIYEMLAGAPPFVGETWSDVIAAILKSDAPPLLPRVGALPRELERIVEKALRKDREERYRSIKELLIDVRDVQRELHFQSRRERTTSSHGPVQSGDRTIQPQTASASSVEPHGAPSRLPSIFGRHKRLTLATVCAVGALLVGLGAFTYSRQFRGALDLAPLRPAPGPMTQTRLSTAGRVLEATVSPDGRLVAYVAGEGIHRTAYVQPTATGNAIAVVPPSETGAHDLIFAPDSSRLFFLRNEPATAINELYEVRVAGGRARKVITDVDSKISFAPDGRRFVFSRGYPDSRESCLIVAAVDGSGERKLATRQIAESFLGNPVWSPDGRTVASVAIDPTAGNEQQRHIVVIDAADGTQKVLGRTRWRWSTTLAWVPDGRELLLTAKEHASVPFQIWRIGYPGGEVLNTTNDLYDYSGVSVTSDASALVTVQTSATAALFVAPAADLMNARRLTPDAAVTFYGTGWTPDGKILYGSNAGGHRNIWVMNADGSEPRRLTNDAFVNDNPVATPDGRYVVYQSERSGYGNVWRMNADGSNPRQITYGNSANNPSVTPDSRWIVYAAASVATARLRKVSIDGGDPEELTTATSHFPVVSPDGRSIAFSYYAGGTASTRLSIVAIGGGTPRQSFRGAAWPWRWEPDGRTLIYVDNRPGYSNFMRLPLNTGVPTHITAFSSGHISAFDISRDGRRVVFIRGSATSAAVMIRKFR